MSTYYTRTDKPYEIKTKYLSDHEILIYTRDLPKYKCKDLFFNFKDDEDLSLDFVITFIGEVAASMIDGEKYSLNALHQIIDGDDHGFLTHVFSLKKKKLFGADALRVQYCLNEMVTCAKDGYTYIFNPNANKWIRVDKLVYVTFNSDEIEEKVKDGKTDDDFDIIHIDGDKTNNRLDNLIPVWK